MGSWIFLLAILVFLIFVRIIFAMARASSSGAKGPSKQRKLFNPQDQMIRNQRLAAESSRRQQQLAAENSRRQAEAWRRNPANPANPNSMNNPANPNSPLNLNRRRP